VKIVDCLLEPKLLGVACRALRKHRQGGWDVIGCPVMPGAGRRVGIIAEKGKAAGTSRRIRRFLADALQRAHRQHHVTYSPRWTSSPLRSSLSFWYTQPATCSEESC
jgi:hypothetical protein